MAGGLLGIASSGLLAFQRSLTTISHNITNVNTEGYSRQTADLVTREPEYVGRAGYMGTGVDVKTIRRSYDDFLTAQVRTSTSAHAELDAYYNLAIQVDNIISDPDSSVASALQAFYDSIHDVANEPTSIPVRRVMLTSAETLTNRFNTLNGSFNSLRSQVDESIENSLDQLNSQASSLAALNQKIALALGSTGGTPPNDLLDQRDQLVLDMAKHLDVHVVPQSDGTVNLFVGSGQALVMGTEAATLKIQDSMYGGGPKDIALYAKGSSNYTIITSRLSGGDIGGLMSFEKEFLDPAQSDLGRIAAAFSAQYNDQ
ncbi:MAG: hypothetical protein H6R26_2018, partial [Proteobacteria bacterium]|nr:hypothetical protein [Pseudomonadota bacterium]